MRSSVNECDEYYRVNINDYKPVVNFGHPEREERTELKNIVSDLGNLSIKETEDSVILRYPMEINTHIIGLGERAFSTDRRRQKFSSFNRDPSGYSRGDDPIYVPIPFFVAVHNGVATGIFVNYPGEIYFDFGVETYNSIAVEVKSKNAEVFVFKSRQVKGIVDDFIKLTGKPFLPPKWAVGHAISKYTYYPWSQVKEVIEKYKQITSVDSVYLDIHFMDGFRLFTWDFDKFGDGKVFLEDIHKLGAKVVTIVDPSIKVDQSFDLFAEGLGNYVEEPNGDIYTGKMWPGLSAFPDFFNSDSRDYWKKRVKKWVEQGVDGIWLDMNEPTVLNETHMLDPEALHRLDDGERVPHRRVRNAYPYFQNQATYEAMEEVTPEPFILSRSGYAGIQKYSAVWSGDNKSTWDDVRLQISVVTSMSLSGITVTGCDIGGFMGNSSPELMQAYYRMALFFPIYRNHNDKVSNDQEVFLLSSNTKNDIVETIALRYRFLDHIYGLLQKSHDEGVPVVSPLAYLYQNDDSFFADDEYLLGENLLYAPQIYDGKDSRKLYIPEGEWVDFWTGEHREGPMHFSSNEKYPIFIRNNSAVIYDKKIIVFGSGEFTLYIDGPVKVTSDGETPKSDREIEGYTFQQMK